MKAPIKKVCLIIYASIFATSAIFLVYTDHVYFGVSQAIRLIDLRINYFHVEIQNNKTFIITNFTIQNPSSYEFIIKIIQEKVYLETVDEKGYIYNTIKSGEITLNGFSKIDFTVSIDVPEHKLNRVNNAVNKKWFVVFYVTIESFILKTLTLSFIKEL